MNKYKITYTIPGDTTTYTARARGSQIWTADTPEWAIEQAKATLADALAETDKCRNLYDSYYRIANSYKYNCEVIK